MVTYIKKRNGSVVEFQKEKIRAAIGKAALAVNSAADSTLLDAITDYVVSVVEVKFPETMPDVEAVQDVVEVALMKYGFFDVAKAYIIYRAEHGKIREEKKQKIIQKIANRRLYIKGIDGKKTLFDPSVLYDDFVKAAKGLEKLVDVDELVERCESNMYEGMTAIDLGRAEVLTARTMIEKDPAYSTISTRLAVKSLYLEVVAEPKVDFNDGYRQAFIKNLNQAVESKRLVPQLLNFDLESLAKYIKPERDELLEYMGFQTLYDRYLIREEGGERRMETIQAFWMRVSMGLAVNEGLLKNRRAKEFYDIISTLKYMPSTPTLFHAGTTYPQLSSCYLNTVMDDLEHIFKTFGDNAQLSKYSGGIGTDWTNIRGTGSLIKTTNVGSQGVIPFLKIANDVTVAINRSGKRRGATCSYLETWHYDIEDFIDLRKNTGDERRRTHDMSTASWVPDLFMKRVINDGEWTLFSTDETPDLHHLYGKEFEKQYEAYERKAAQGKIKLFKKVSAKTLWRKMLTSLFETGHPWITFKDPCNVRSPQDHVGVVHCSNLCTEITLNTSQEETAVCNLGSINLPRHFVKGVLDYQALEETVRIAMRMLDNVIDINYYPTKEAKHSNMFHRPVGLGIMGFQDALYLQGINFESEAAIQFADESMEFISYHAIMTSTELAKERGPYASFKGSKWDRGIFPVDTLDLLEKERGMDIEVSRVGKMDWAPVKAAVKQHGMRNSNTMAIAPTATISNISGCYPCIEPIYKNIYVKSNMSGEFTVVNKYLIADLKKAGLWNEEMLNELKKNDGNVARVPVIPEELRSRYKEAFEIDASWLMMIAAHRGKWIDQSQSLNIFSATSSGRYLSDVYTLGWKLGLKTTYYLRTLGASSVEKSTVDVTKMEASTILRQKGITDVTASVETVETETENEPEKVAEEPAVEEKVRVGVAATSESPMMQMEVKACLIDDPNCEACQ